MRSQQSAFSLDVIYLIQVSAPLLTYHPTVPVLRGNMTSLEEPETLSNTRREMGATAFPRESWLPVQATRGPRTERVKAEIWEMVMKRARMVKSIERGENISKINGVGEFAGGVCEGRMDADTRSNDCNYSCDCQSQVGADGKPVEFMINLELSSDTDTLISTLDCYVIYKRFLRSRKAKRNRFARFISPESISF